MDRRQLSACVLVLTSIGLGATAAGAPDAERISRIVGVPAPKTPDGVVRVAWPRTDVPLRVDGLPFRAPMGLGSWAAFQATPDGVRVMGDTVVFEDEVSPAIDAALEGGLEVTALHNHFFFDEPKVYFLHIGGSGSLDALASGVRMMWDAVKDVRRRRPAPATVFSGGTPSYGEMDIARLEETIGEEGKLTDGVFKIALGRPARMHGVDFGGSMGLTTWMAFAGSDELAAVAGDFAMRAGEIQAVLRALRKADIHIVALHNHMLGESPAFYFAHFWGKGPAAKLASGLRAALDAQNAAGSESASVTGLVADFEAMETTNPPDGFSTALTGGGGPPVWVIQEDPTAPSGKKVLVQTTSDDTNYRFPVCVDDGFTAKDLDLSVAFKPISGRVDQAAGLVWRYRDSENYYVVRANALEDNVVLYKVENGKRSDLKPKGARLFSYGKKAPVRAQRWSTLRVRVRGPEFSVSLNGEHLFDVEDDTFSDPGKVGVWTKADSVTAFDALTAKGP